VIAGDGAVVRGVVRDKDGLPIAGAQIRLVDSTIARRCPDLLVGSAANLWLAAGPDKPTGSEAIKSRTARSNAEGQFEISRGPDSAPGILLILTEGFAPHLETLGSGQVQKITLDGGSDVELRLVIESEKPVEDAEVALVPLTICGPVVEAFSDLLVLPARGNPEGKVLFRDVSPGTYALRLSGKGRLTSNVAPLIVRAGANRFRLRVPWGRTLRGKIEYPSHTVHSSGSVVAFWKDPEGVLQWTEALFSGDEGDFELNGLPFGAPVRL
jgi:hypothetical protein